MQGEGEPECENNTSKLTFQCHCYGRDVLTMKRCGNGKCLNMSKKPFWFTRRRSKVKLPTRFLLGGNINDPLNLQGLQKESDRQSHIDSFEQNSRVLTTNHSRRIGFPDITDPSDPLNLKTLSSEEQQLLSDDSTTSLQKGKNTGSTDCCQVLHTLPFIESEGISEQRGLSLDSSADMKEKVSPCNSSLMLSERNQHCIEERDCSINAVDVGLPVEVSCTVTDSISDRHMPSVLSEVETVACTRSSKFASHEKIVSPAVPQFSHHRARKRRRHSARASREIVPSASSSHKSLCKKKKEKFPCGNYVAYYGYRNVDRVKDPRLELLPKELFAGKDVLDIGCNAGMVTVAVASAYLPKIILGIDVDQRLIGLAKRNVQRYMNENSYPSCLKTTFGPIATSLLPSTACAAFPHNILFQVVITSDFILWLLQCTV